MKMSDSSGEPAVGVGAGVANGQVIRLLSGSTYGIAARSNDQEFTGSNPPSVQVCVLIWFMCAYMLINT